MKFDSYKLVEESNDDFSECFAPTLLWTFKAILKDAYNKCHLKYDSVALTFR